MFNWHPSHSSSHCSLFCPTQVFLWTAKARWPTNKSTSCVSTASHRLRLRGRCYHCYTHERRRSLFVSDHSELRVQSNHSIGGQGECRRGCFRSWLEPSISMQSFLGTSQVCNAGQRCNLTHSVPNEAASDEIMELVYFYGKRVCSMVCKLIGNQRAKGILLLLGFAAVFVCLY